MILYCQEWFNFFSMSTEIRQPQDPISERWARTHQLHCVLSEFLVNEGYIVPARKLFNGRAFDSYVYRSFSFTTETASGEKIQVLFRALELPRDHNVIVDIDGMNVGNKHLLLSSQRLFNHQPPTPEELDLLEDVQDRLAE